MTSVCPLQVFLLTHAVLPVEIQLFRRGSIGSPWTCLTRPIFEPCQDGDFQRYMSWYFLGSMSWGGVIVCFVAIGVNFLLSLFKLFWWFVLLILVVLFYYHYATIFLIQIRHQHSHYSMLTKVIPFPPSSLYISYKTIYFHNILMKSFLIGFSWNF